MRLPRPAASRGFEAKSKLEKALGIGLPRPKLVVVVGGLTALFIAGILLLVGQIFLKPALDPVTFEVTRGVTIMDQLDESKSRSPTLLSMDQHVYYEEDMPYWDEKVVDYRARLAQMMPYRRPGTIFVSIASFRDNLCQQTLQRIFEKAKHPSRVFVGVCDQYRFDDPDDIPCDNAKLTELLKKNVRLVRVKAANGKGPTHARYIASKLWDGEEIFMQIDGHSNFVQDWDEGLFENLNALPNPFKSIVTHYPTSGDEFLGKDQLLPWICMSTKENAPPGLVIQLPSNCADRHRSEGIALTPDGKKTTCHTPFLGAGFFAGRSSLLIDAPFDKYLKFLFHGEELLIASRLWTNGWDLYTPNQNFVSHAYGGRDKNVFVEVPTWYIDARKSEARARELLEAPLPDDDKNGYDRLEIEELGMGNVRPLQDYLEYAGLDLKNDTRISRCDQRYDVEQHKWIDVPSE